MQVKVRITYKPAQKMNKVRNASEIKVPTMEAPSSPLVNTIYEQNSENSKFSENSENSIIPLMGSSNTTPVWKSINLQYTFYEEIPDSEFLIKRAVNKKTCDVVAIKIIDKSKEEEQFLHQIRNEIEIMWHLDHKHILNLMEVHEEPENLYLVHEYFSGEKLQHRIINEGPFTEDVAAKIILQLLLGIQHMHEAGVCHRDLKPENILIEGDVVKISEFALSRNYKTFMKTTCGTPEYVAPEILAARPYTNSVDIWSLGVITYVMLCKFTPFSGDTDSEIFAKILQCKYEFPSPSWDTASEHVIDFISNILILDFTSRPSAADCLESPWVREKALVMK